MVTLPSALSTTYIASHGVSDKIVSQKSDKLSGLIVLLKFSSNIWEMRLRVFTLFFVSTRFEKVSISKKPARERKIEMQNSRNTEKIKIREKSNYPMMK